MLSRETNAYLDDEVYIPKQIVIRDGRVRFKDLTAICGWLDSFEGDVLTNGQSCWLILMRQCKPDRRAAVSQQQRNGQAMCRRGASDHT